MNVNSLVGSMFDSLTESTGVRAGLLLTDSHLRKVLAGAYPDERDKWWELPTHYQVRMRAEEVSQLILDVLHGVGALTDNRAPGDLLVHYVLENVPRIKRPPERFLDAEFPRDEEHRFHYPWPSLLHLQYFAWGQSELLSGRVPPGFEDVAEQYFWRMGPDRFFQYGRTWDGILALDTLFHLKEKGGAVVAGDQSAPLIDQRLIDYLHAQPSDLDSIHWRQFEYLCGEWFRRTGYEVEVTPQSGDGGVDVIAKRMDGAQGPDVILVQAKRLGGRAQVDINVVKALWADVLESEESTRGLITTTTRLAKGAREYTEARKYRLGAAERQNVEEWIDQLTTHSKPA